MSGNPIIAAPGGAGISNFNSVAEQYRLNGELPPDLATQQEGLSRKQQIANLLIQRGLRGLPGGQMAGRFYVKDSPAQGAAQLAEVLAGAFGTHLVDKGQKEIGRQRQAGLDEVRDAWLHAQSPVPAVPPSNLNPSPPAAIEPQAGPMASPQQDVTQALLAQLGPNPSQANLPQGIPNDLQQPIGGGQVTHPMTGQVLDPASIATPPMPGEPPPPQLAQAPPPMQTADMPMPQGTPIAMPPQNQGPVSPGTPGGPRDPREIQALVTQAMLHQDPLVRHFGQFMAQQQAGQQEHEAQRAAIAQDKKEQREFTHKENIARIDADLAKEHSHINSMVALRVMSDQDAAKARKEADERHADLMKGLNKTTTDTQKQIAAAHDATQKDIAKGHDASKLSSKSGAGMSATAQKELIQTEEEVQAQHQTIKTLDQALAINDKAMGFTGAGAIAQAGSVLPEGLRPKVVDDTLELDNLVTSSVLPQLRSTFGGNPTEGERRILLDVAGASSKPASVRKGIFERAQAAMNARIKFNSQKVEQLRKGTYFSGEGGVDTTVPAAPAPAATSGPVSIKGDADFDALPPGTLFIGPDGKTRKK